MEIVRALHATLGGAEGFWLAVTNLGHDFAFILFLTLYLWLVNPRGGRTLGIFFALAIIVDALLNFIPDQKRPYQFDPTLASEAARSTSGGSSFPSGHALVSATLWGLAALQIRRAWFYWLAGAVVFMIALSRVVLGLHFPHDVLAGLAIGAVLALIGARVQLPDGPALARFAVPVAALLIAAFLPKSDLSTGLGILAGFWLARPSFEAPRTWAGRVAFVLIGLTLVLVVYFGFRVLPADLRDTGIINALRYVAVVLTATEIVPRVLRRFTTHPDVPSTTPA